MAEYIRQINPGLLQNLTQAQMARDSKSARSSERIAEAVAKAINEHYKDKEMKIQQAKANKLKESLALLDFAKTFETGPSMPAGVGGVPAPGIQPLAPSIGPAEQVIMPGYQQIPQAITEMGGPAGVMRPRERAQREYETIDETTSKAIEKEFGIKLPAGTPRAVATTAIAQKGASDRAAKRRQAYSKYDQAYKELSDMVKDLPAVPVASWSELDKKNYDAWLKATKERGITIEDVALMSEEAPPEQKGWFMKLIDLIGYDKPANRSGGAKPAAAPKAKSKDPLGLL